MYLILLFTFLSNIKNNKNVFLPIHMSDNILPIIIQEKNIFNNMRNIATSGCDERNLINDDKNNTLTTIKKNFVKLYLLQKLENNNISKIEKLNYIEDYNKMYDEKPEYKSDITAGLDFFEFE